MVSMELMATLNHETDIDGNLAVQAAILHDTIIKKFLIKRIIKECPYLEWLVFDKEENVKAIASQVIDWMKFVLKKHAEKASMMNFDRVIKQWNLGVDRICRDAPQLVFAYASLF